MEDNNTNSLEAAFAQAFASKGKCLVNVQINSCMGGKEGGLMRVARRTTHKRGYWTRSLTLTPADGSKSRWTLRVVEHKGGKLSAATGDMGATLVTLEVQG